MPQWQPYQNRRHLKIVFKSTTGDPKLPGTLCSSEAMILAEFRDYLLIAELQLDYPEETAEKTSDVSTC